MSRRLLVFAAAFAAIGSFPDSSRASELIARNAQDVRLSVSKRGVALVTFRAAGRRHRVLASGALNARPPTRSRPQISFRLDYSPGRVGFRNACRPYDGPKLDWLVAACKAPDGSYWALQSW